MFLTNITCIDIDVLYCLVKPQGRATNYYLWEGTRIIQIQESRAI